jgi:hypothetical protein
MRKGHIIWIYRTIIIKVVFYNNQSCNKYVIFSFDLYTAILFLFTHSVHIHMSSFYLIHNYIKSIDKIHILAYLTFKEETYVFYIST